MSQEILTRRSCLALANAAALPGWRTAALAQPAAPRNAVEAAGRAHRMQWWHEAKFGMFIHFGLFSVLGKDVWNFESEGWTMAEYEPLIHQFNPRAGSPREWARLARRAGQKYTMRVARRTLSS